MKSGCGGFQFDSGVYFEGVAAVVDLPSSLENRALAVPLEVRWALVNCVLQNIVQIKDFFAAVATFHMPMNGHGHAYPGKVASSDRGSAQQLVWQAHPVAVFLDQDVEVVNNREKFVKIQQIDWRNDFALHGTMMRQNHPQVKKRGMS